MCEGNEVMHTGKKNKGICPHSDALSHVYRNYIGTAAHTGIELSVRAMKHGTPLPIHHLPGRAAARRVTLLRLLMTVVKATASNEPEGCIPIQLPLAMFLWTICFTRDIPLLLA